VHWGRAVIYANVIITLNHSCAKSETSPDVLRNPTRYHEGKTGEPTPRRRRVSALIAGRPRRDTGACCGGRGGGPLRPPGEKCRSGTIVTTFDEGTCPRPRRHACTGEVRGSNRASGHSCLSSPDWQGSKSRAGLGIPESVRSVRTQRPPEEAGRTGRPARPPRRHPFFTSVEKIS
jgi:hypothetical protein